MNYSRSLGHFLENRSQFLKNLKSDIFKYNSASSETKFLSNLRALIDSKSSSDTFSDDLSIQTMLNCSMHLGHSKSYWNPKMAKYLLGERSGIHIIDLDKTLACLRQAASVTADIAHKGGKILFVGTSDSLQRLTYETASFCDQFYVNKRWVGGTISNSKSIIGSAATPDLVVIFDLKKNLVAAKECSNGNIPVIAICDSDCDPDLATYPIPSNDESLPGIELVAKVLAMSAHRGKTGKLL